MMDKNQKRDIVRLLLNDHGVLRNWKEFCDSLDIEEHRCVVIYQKFQTGTGMQEVFKDMLDSWTAQFGNKATIDELLSILKKNRLKSAFDAIESNFKEIQDTLKFPDRTKTSEKTIERNLQLLERLDSGEFGDVYKAKGTFDHELYAIKRISIGKFISLTKATSGEDYFSKLLREVKTMAKLGKCDQVVRYLDAWFEGPNASRFQKAFTTATTSEGCCVLPVEQGKPKMSLEDDQTYFCIKMPLCDKNLATWIEDNEKRNLKVCERIVQEILTGLAYIHKQNILHRDLKPNNILINILDKETGQFSVKIGDFGLAREVQVEKGGDLTANFGADFSSPEMHLGRGDYDEKTDIYSLGLIYLILVYQFGSVDEMKWTFSGLRKSQGGNNKALGQIMEKVKERHGKRDFKLLKSMLSFQKENRPTAKSALQII